MGPPICVGLRGKGGQVVGEVGHDQVGDTDTRASFAFLEGRNPIALDTAVARATACRAILQHKRIVVRRRVEDGSRAARILGKEQASLEVFFRGHGVPLRGFGKGEFKIAVSSESSNTLGHP